MKPLPILLAALIGTCLPALAGVNLPPGGTCGSGGGCDSKDEGENKDSWSWWLDIGEVEFKSTNNLLGYARTGVTEGSLRGGPVRTFGDIYSSFNGGNTTKQNILIYFDEKVVSSSIANPAVLRIDDAMTSAEVIRSTGAIRQVLTDSVLTDVTPLVDGSGYTVKTWFLSAINTPVKNAGFYTLPADIPYFSITFSNPDHPADLHRIDKTVVENTGNSTRTVTTRYEETYLPAPNEGMPDTFTISTFGGAGVSGTQLRKETITYTDRGAGTASGAASATNTRRYWDYNLERVIEEATLSPAGVLGALETISHTYEQFADFSVYNGSGPDRGGVKGARRMVSMTAGYGTANARTTTFTYINTPANSYVHGRIQSKTGYDGSWEYYEYNDTNNAPVATQTRWSSWKNVLMADKENAMKTITTIEPSAATTVTTVAGQLVSQEETSLENVSEGGGAAGLRTTVREKIGSEWSVSVSYRYPQNNVPLTSGRIKWMENPDGTATTYAYASTPDGYTVTRDSGAGSRTGITAGTRVVETYNKHNVLLGSSSYDIESNLLMDAWVKSDLDNKGRPQRTDYPLDGTYAISQYSCCGIGFSRDRSGATDSYFRDPLKRVYMVTSKRSSTGPEVFTATDYDGLTVKTTRSSGATTLNVSETTRNLAGETVEMKSPDANGDGVMEATTRTYQYQTVVIPQPKDLVGEELEAWIVDNTVSKFVTTTFPDGSDAFDASFSDGRTQWTAGSAVLATYFDYGTHDMNGGGTWAKQTKANGTEWVKTYSDSLGRTFQTEFADTATSTTSYHPFTAAKGSRGKTAGTTDPDGVSASYAYDAEGDLSQTNEQMPGNQQRITVIGNDVVTDPDIGISMRRTTTVNGILVSTSLSQAIGYASKSVTLSGTSKSIRTVPADGAWTVTSTSADGQKTVQIYTDGLLKLTEMFDNQGTAPANLITSTVYTQDGFGRTLTTVDSRTGTTTMGTILENGSYLSVTDPGGRITAFTYDVMGRVTTTDLPDTLDADGNPLTNITLTSYTARGEVAGTWGAQTNPIFRIYDALGRLVELRTYQSLAPGTEPVDDTAGYAKTTWIYSAARGFLTGKRDNADKGADYTYTPAGRLLTRTWARGTSTTYGYDAGMLATTDYSDTTPDVLMTYDSFGRPVSVKNGASTVVGGVFTIANPLSGTTYAYDAATLVLDTETIAYDLDTDGTPEITRVLDYSQDGLLRPDGWQLKDGATAEHAVSYGYDNAGRLKHIDPTFPLTGSPAFTYTYEAGSCGLAETVTGPSHTVTNTWDTTRDTLSLRENEAGATNISTFGYGVNAIGQRTGVAQTGTAFGSSRDFAWGYDPLGQVTKADSSISGLDRSYQYDLIGNRLKSADSLSLPGADNYVVNSLNQYTSVPSVASAPTYDDDGNATAYPVPADPTANSNLVWDAENRLTSITVDSSTTTYLYDSQSRRISKKVGSGTPTVYFYDGWNPISEYTGITLEQSYTWGMDLSGSMQGAGGVGGLLAVNDGSASYYPTYDGNGNVNEYLDSTGGVVAHYEYDPFGNTTVATGTKVADFSHRFSTKPLDDETGLYYYGYRYYDPKTGRWPSRDPIEEEGGVNLYGFVGNDGVNAWDFLGLMTVHYGFITPTSVSIQDGAGDKRRAGITYWSGDVSCQASDCEIDCMVIAASQILMNTAAHAKGTKMYNEAVNHEKMHVMSWVKKVKDWVVGPLLLEESDCKNADECSERAKRLQKQYMEILLGLLYSTDHKDMPGSTVYSPIHKAYYGQITQMGAWKNDIDRGKEAGSVDEGFLVFKTKK